MRKHISRTFKRARFTDTDWERMNKHNHGLSDVVDILFYFYGVLNMLENKFKTELIKKIKSRFPGSFIFHLDPTELQGAPDLLVLYKDRWAALEGKKNKSASLRPNQQYYVDLFDKMSFARIIFPENAKEVLDEMEQSFKI